MGDELQNGTQQPTTEPAASTHESTEPAHNAEIEQAETESESVGAGFFGMADTDVKSEPESESTPDDTDATAQKDTEQAEAQDEKTPDKYRTNSGNIELVTPVEVDTDFTVSYLIYHPSFDGTEEKKLINDDELLILGGTYKALAFRLSPETAAYRQDFDTAVRRFYRDNSFTIKMTKDNWRNAGAREALSI